MQVSRLFNVFKVAAKGAGRYAMERAKLEITAPCIVNQSKPDEVIVPGKGRLLATDGRALVSVPCDVGPHDVAGFITREAWDAARKIKRGRNHPLADQVAMEANGSLAIVDGATFPRPTNGEFPRVDAVLGTDENGPRCNPGPKITFNPQYLANLASALGSDECVSIVLPEKDSDGRYSSPLYVIGKTDSNGKPIGEGLLMPITVDS